MWLGMAKNGGLERNYEGNRTSETLSDRLDAIRFPTLYLENRIGDSQSMPNVTATSRRLNIVFYTSNTGKRERRVL